MSASPEQPIFGRLLTAMITPFGPDGKVNLTEAARLAQHLVDNQGHDGLVINGTTGESPTTSDEEKRELLGTVIEAVGDRASVVAGVGTFDTHHTIELSRQAAEAGADGLLVVTPYYSRPPVDALEEHFLAVADASELPIMLYDIPHRAGIPIPETSLIRLAGHPRIAAVKDAKGDICSSSMVIANSTLTYYAGDDAYLLPLLAVGGAGVVGTSTHFSGLQVRALLDAFVAGDFEQARQLNAQLLPVFRGVFATQGTMMVKAALNRCGFDVGMCRPPMGKVAPELLERFLEILDAQL
jgi:dihydrodipicolinate synthase